MTDNVGNGFKVWAFILLMYCSTTHQELKYELGPSMIILYDIAGVLKYVFLVFPPFAFAIGIKDLAVSFTKASVMARFEMDVYVSPFSWDLKMQGGLGLHYFSLALWTVVGTVVLLSWQDCVGALPKTAAPAKNLAGAEEEKDVAAERIKIQCGGTSLYDTVLRLVGLGRDFTSPPTTAVSNLFLALRRGECFSLLGLNGAGKTTTFRCLTGDLRPTRGQILVNGLVLEEALALPYPIMGYCPQSHALDPNLTAREALSIMALIRGFSSRETTVVLERVIEQLGLSGEDNTYIHQLSGGTKRKLSTALALLANPLLVLLDEPTTGMDPASRRLAWRAIRSVTDDGRTVLLTSHSMDEVNQLSHRMAIMVNGQFICIGSPHYLKYKLGDKYTIRLKTNDIEDMECVLDFLCSQLADVLLKEQHHLTIVAEVSRQLPLRLIFDTLNTARSMGVTEYDVSQTTLNEVFRVLTSNQGDGQVPPPPITNNYEQVSIPVHLSNQLPVDIQQQSPDIIFQPPANVPHSSLLPSVEEQDCTSYDRESLYDNVETDKQEIYATVGKVSSMRKPSPDLYQENESGSADDSPEEEWTHL
nr:ATP-binding cassette sub-family A member 2-like [Procambarus clarkii]